MDDNNYDNIYDKIDNKIDDKTRNKKTTTFKTPNDILPSKNYLLFVKVNVPYHHIQDRELISNYQLMKLIYH